MMKKSLLAATALSLAVATPALLRSAHATPVTFFGEDPNATGGTPIPHPVSDSTQASFFTHLNDPGTETLDGFAPGTTTVDANFNNGVTATLSGGEIQNTSSAGRFAISSPNYYSTNTSSFGINFSSGISAFGFYGTDIGDFGGALTLTLTDAANNVSTLAVPAAEGSGGSQPENGSVLYFGFYDSADTYKSISFNNSSTSDVFGFDNFTVGTAQQIVPVPVPVPEPAALAVLGTGLLSLGLVRRRRRRG